MGQENTSSLEYTVSRAENDLLFADRNGRTVAFIKKQTNADNYSILTPTTRR